MEGYAFGKARRCSWKGIISMWPFGKKHDLPGFKRDEKGNLTFDLTEEEQQEVENTFKMFEGGLFRSDVANDMQNGITAFALSNYVTRQVMMSEMESQKENREKILVKAIAAIVKAYSFYELPIYIYDLACFMEMAGRIDVARDIFRDFLKKQTEFKPGQIDELLLKQRNIDEAIKDAKAKAI